jgi:hypothetical protein
MGRWFGWIALSVVAVMVMIAGQQLCFPSLVDVFRDISDDELLSGLVQIAIQQCNSNSTRQCKTRLTACCASDHLLPARSSA